MSPVRRDPTSRSLSFPRVSGDEPTLSFAGVASDEFSPRERG